MLRGARTCNGAHLIERLLLGRGGVAGCGLAEHALDVRAARQLVFQPHLVGFLVERTPENAYLIKRSFSTLCQNED